MDKTKKYKFEDTKELYRKLLIENNPSIKNEEDLKIHFTREIRNFFDNSDLTLDWSFEHQLKSKKRLDALVNNRTIIELKKPNYFSLQTNIDKTKKKIEEEYIDKKEEAERINAVFYDGYKLGFYENKEFIGVLLFDENSTRKLVYLLLNNEKKVFNSENLINDFQRTKSLDKFAHQLFFILENSRVLNKIKILFSEWKRLFNLSETDRNRSEDYLKKMSLQLIELNKKKWNGIWINIIKQFYKASKIEDMDLIIGNPPWISWRDLPENYRNRIKLLKNVKSIFGVSRNIGGNNLNVCGLMANVVASRKLNYQTGCLGFIMPKSLLFNASYEGFRPFILENGERLYLQKYFNFDKVKKPFEEVDLKFGVYFYSSQKIDYQKGVEQVIFYSKEKSQIKKSNLLVSTQKKLTLFQ